ncbi:MAG: hypothetical protein KAS32_25990 [Candidatus Peribacteraceae bacterium]|nr:hypothetical protein [Candidatus Peribacteraceae bacterium]
MSTKSDDRGLNPHENPVARYSIDQMSWLTGAGHAEKTEDIIMNGMLEAIGIRVSSVTGDPDVTITLTDANGNEFYNSTALNDGTDYYYTPSEFLPTAEKMPLVGPITVGVDPSADAGGSGQDLTVDVDLFIT